MSFPDIVAGSESAACPSCAAGCSPNQPLAELTWFRVGGPAQVLFMPEDESDLAYFLEHPAGRDSGHRDRARLQPDRARRRRAGRRDPARPRLRRGEGRSGQSRPRRHRGARRQGRARRAGGGDRGARLLPRHSRRDRRRAAHERRRLWPRDQGRAGRGARRRPRRATCASSATPTCITPIAIAARPRTSSSRRRCSRARPAIRRRSPPRWTRSPSRARRPSRSRAAPAARPSRIRPATRPGS